MFKLIKFIIWIIGLITVAYFVLPYFGYEFNLKYLSESKAACEKRLKECSDLFIRQGIENPNCDPAQCVDKKLIIKKKQ